MNLSCSSRRRRLYKHLRPLLLLLLPGMVEASEVTGVAREWRKANEELIVERFYELLSIPNVASDTINIWRNADHISAMLREAGMTVSLLELGTNNPAVYGERLVPGAERTVLIYIHYDGQPVNPRTGLLTPGRR